MAVTITKQSALKIKKGMKRETRTQFAALCYRLKGEKLQFLLITSRHRKRWILPKGWPEDKLTPSEAAAKEAWEEAGVVGTCHDTVVGLYHYSKVHGPLEGVPKLVMVFPLEVTTLKKKFPEMGERKRKWFSAKAAAARVDEKQLKKIIKTFDPNTLRLLDAAQ